jgi:hypothetical protein
MFTAKKTSGSFTTTNNLVGHNESLKIQITPYFKDEPTFTVIEDPKKSLWFFESNIAVTVVGKIKGTYAKEFQNKASHSMLLEVLGFKINDKYDVDENNGFEITALEMGPYLSPAIVKVAQAIQTPVANKLGEPNIFIKHNAKLTNIFFEPVSPESFMTATKDDVVKVDCDLKIYFDTKKKTAGTCIVAKKIYE